MGIMRIGPSVRYVFDDEPLAHLQAVILAELEHHHSFLLLIQHTPTESPTTVTVNEETTVSFTYDTVNQPALDPATLHWLSAEIALTGSLHCSDR
ncbi:hypothetical protein [Plantibacter sp. YIM 135347]|uniref:DUF7882 family protein n=1 Tax=Plantibacter sp. YIM 135347 TaxID=3423919 RepID=UPI003D34A103